MFIDEITPIIKELTSQPVAFLGGFFSGVFQLKLSEDPLKSWLAQQGNFTISYKDSNGKDNDSRPQSITID
ncbi:MAG: hypothetical protein F6K10_16875 [Moorea sp. SIO2B7]|nr:hypothetical protein [Moorena sp. SIO2B7]